MKDAWRRLSRAVRGLLNARVKPAAARHAETETQLQTWESEGGATRPPIEPPSGT